MAPPIIEPVWCVTRLKRSTSTSCRCPATAPTSCRSRRSGAGSARMSPIITVIPPPRISAGEWPLSRSASIRTPAPSPIASGSKITSTLTKKNYASQTRRGLTGEEQITDEDRAWSLIRNPLPPRDERYAPFEYIYQDLGIEQRAVDFTDRSVTDLDGFTRD